MLYLLDHPRTAPTLGRRRRIRLDEAIAANGYAEILTSYLRSEPTEEGRKTKMYSELLDGARWHYLPETAFELL